MKNSIIEQFHNSIEQFILPVDYTDLIKKTDMVYTFNEVMEGVNLHKYVKQSRKFDTSTIKIPLQPYTRVYFFVKFYE